MFLIVDSMTSSQTAKVNKNVLWLPGNKLNPLSNDVHAVSKRVIYTQSAEYKC